MTLDESIGLWEKEHKYEIVHACNMDMEVHEIVDRVNPWHTGTPTENGYYLCKVFHDKDTPNDMRILEWVSSLDCFCIPYSEIRAYHYYVGENNGEDVEVVYEWQKLDTRFRMETKWIEPYKENEDGMERR